LQLVFLCRKSILLRSNEFRFLRVLIEKDG
jgi:hypothetical protein